MKLLLGSVAIALAGGSTPAALPYKLPLDVGGFAFGDDVETLRGKCDKLGAREGKEDRPRFYADVKGNFAGCEDVKTGKPYLPAVTELTFVLRSGSLVSVSARLPMPTLLEYARQIARAPRAEVEGQRYCRTFADGVGGVCVDLATQVLMLTL